MSKKMSIPLIHENTIQHYHSAAKEDFRNNYKLFLVFGIETPFLGKEARQDFIFSFLNPEE